MMPMKRCWRSDVPSRSEVFTFFSNASPINIFSLCTGLRELLCRESRGHVRFALRNHKEKAVFNLKDCPGPECGLALEQNYQWVMELCATLAGADPWPPHKAFKAGRHLVLICT